MQCDSYLNKSIFAWCYLAFILPLHMYQHAGSLAVFAYPVVMALLAAPAMIGLFTTDRDLTAAVSASIGTIATIYYGWRRAASTMD